MISATEGRKWAQGIAYARFSPRRDADTCESCDSQLRDLREYCRRNHIKITGEYRDEALSGGDGWDERPGMFDAYTACKRGDIFVVRSWDRLFRDTEKALVFRSLLRAKGVQVCSITEEVANDETPVGRLVTNMLLSIAEFQREVTRARTRAKMLLYQSEGRRMSEKPPWGTRRDPANPARLVRDINECSTIDLICQLYRDKKMTFRGIANWLEENNIPSRGKHWSHKTVSRILRREGVAPTKLP